MGFDFAVIVPLLPSHCGFSFVFGCGVSFLGEFQCLPVNDCSAVSCDSGVHARGSESTSFYSAILNQSPALGLCCCVQAFSGCGEWGLLFLAVSGLLIAVGSLVAEHGL